LPSILISFPLLSYPSSLSSDFCIENLSCLPEVILIVVVVVAVVATVDAVVLTVAGEGVVTVVVVQDAVVVRVAVVVLDVGPPHPLAALLLVRAVVLAVVLVVVPVVAPVEVRLLRAGHLSLALLPYLVDSSLLPMFKPRALNARDMGLPAKWSTYSPTISRPNSNRGRYTITMVRNSLPSQWHVFNSCSHLFRNV